MGINQKLRRRWKRMVWVDIDSDILKKVQEATITNYEAVDGKVTV